MNRTIEFRGFCKESKEFVYGDIIHGVGAKFGKLYILPNKINLANVKYCDPLDGVNVTPESVGQFTGSTDNNGTKIFEGDIVELFGWGKQVKSDGYASIEYDNDIIGWNFSRSSYAEDRYDFRKAISNCIVIGNIHEHAHLLNSK